MKVDHSHSNVTIGIPTKNRYSTLVLTLQSVALQTVKPDSVIIVDDTDNPTDLRTLPEYQSVFQLFDAKGVAWQVVFGRKFGQHHSHQMVQEMAATDFIWRIDDDEVAEPNVLEELLSQMRQHGPFDYIVFADVLEHLPNPAEIGCDKVVDLSNKSAVVAEAAT